MRSEILGTSDPQASQTWHPLPLHTKFIFIIYHNRCYNYPSQFVRNKWVILKPSMLLLLIFNWSPNPSDSLLKFEWWDPVTQGPRKIGADGLTTVHSAGQVFSVLVSWIHMQMECWSYKLFVMWPYCLIVKWGIYIKLWSVSFFPVRRENDVYAVCTIKHLLGRDFHRLI